jgi:hypothetical protein
MTIMHECHTKESLDAWITTVDTRTMNQSTENPTVTATDKTGITARMGALVDELRARRAARAARTLLIRELSSYTSAADRSDLEATLARHSDAETAEVRRLLSIAQQHRAA